MAACAAASLPDARRALVAAFSERGLRLERQALAALAEYVACAPGPAEGDEAVDALEAEDFPEAIAEGVSQFLGKPRARGWIHLYSAIVAVVAGAALVSVSWALGSTRAGIATLIYTCTIVAINAPLDLDFPPIVWNELVKLGRLNRTRDGLLAIPEKTATRGGL